MSPFAWRATPRLLYAFVYLLSVPERLHVFNLKFKDEFRMSSSNFPGVALGRAEQAMEHSDDLLGIIQDG